MPALGYLTGWAMVMDYILNPLICTILCSKLTQNILPEVPYWVLAVFYATAFTVLNLRGVKTSARINDVLAGAMTIVVIVFFAYVVRFLFSCMQYGPGFFSKPFYDPATFNFGLIFHGTSIAVLTYIGFDAISTFSEEVENPRRNILLATVLVCVVTGVLASLEVYAAQLVWGTKPFPADQVESAFPLVARQAGGLFLFQLLNFTILVANIGSGMGAQLAAARLLYGMGRNDALPKSIFRENYGEKPHPGEQRDSDWRDCAGRVFPAHLRARSGTAEFRRIHRVYGRECGGFRAIFLARGEENGVEFLVADAGFRDLRLHLVELEPASKGAGHDLDRRGRRLRCMENFWLPQDHDIRCSSGVDAGEKRAIAIGQGYAG